MNILYHKKSFRGLADLGDTGQHSVRENIAVDPTVRVDA